MAKTFLNKKNNAKSTITDNPLTSGSTTLNVQTGDGAKFPNAPFHATLYSSDPANGEIIKVTAKSTDQFTIERAKESTAAQEWAQGTKLELLMTAQLLNDFQTRTEIVVATDGSGDYNCDGSSDEDEINEAISNLPAGGGIVRLKQGTYTIDGIIEILKSNVTLEGEGPATVIKAGNASELNRLISIGNGGTTAYSDICIRKLKVDGNRDNQTSGNSSPIVIWGASGYEHKRITVENCWLTGAYLDCLKILEAQECVIKGNHFYNNTGTAIFNNHENNTIIGNVSYGNGYFYYGSACNYTTITGNVSMGDSYGVYISSGWRDAISGNIFDSFANYGIALFGSQRVAVNGNHVYGGSYGILIGNSSSITRYISIAGNTLAWQSTRAIALYAGSGGCVCNAVNGNAIYGSGQEAIYVYRSSYNTITGNAIDGSGRSSTNSYDSIILTDDGATYSTYNLISSNNIQAQQSSKARYHVRENSASDDYNLVIGNICKDGVSGQISLQGSNSVRGTNIPSSG
jgi:parallel beta-helix repeat protein